MTFLFLVLRYYVFYSDKITFKFFKLIVFVIPLFHINFFLVIWLPEVFHFLFEAVLAGLAFAEVFVVVYTAHQIFAAESFAKTFAVAACFVALRVADLSCVVDFAVFLVL
ncbi:MAG: hypothetical protein WKG06_37605 [Segetibacter sp.]